MRASKRAHIGRITRELVQRTRIRQSRRNLVLRDEEIDGTIDDCNS